MLRGGGGWKQLCWIKSTYHLNAHLILNSGISAKCHVNIKPSTKYPNPCLFAGTATK